MRTDARGFTATYSYDALNRATQVAYADQTFNYTYDQGTNFAQVVQLLLSSGTNLNDRTLDGQSALDYAVSLNRRDIIGVLAA